MNASARQLATPLLAAVLALLFFEKNFAQGWNLKLSKLHPELTALEATPDGGVLLGGSLAQPSSLNNRQVWLQKRDAAGHVEWEWKLAPSFSASIAKIQAMALTGGGEIAALFFNSNGESFHRFDAAGNLLSDEFFTPAGTAWVMRETEPDIFLSGGHSGEGVGINGYGAYLRKHQNGNLLWEARLSGGAYINGNTFYRDYLLDVLPMPDSSYLATGGAWVVETPNGNPTPVMYPFLARVATDGKVIFFKHLKNLGQNRNFRRFLRMPDGKILGISNGQPTALVEVFPDGSAQTIAEFPDLQIATMQLAPDGNLLIAGSKAEQRLLKKVQPDGKIIWQRSFSDPKISSYANHFLTLAPDGSIFFGSHTLPLEYLILNKTDAEGNTFTNRLNLQIFSDKNQNCLPDAADSPLQNWQVRVTGRDSIFQKKTDAAGRVAFDLDTGRYEIAVLQPDLFWLPCQKFEEVIFKKFYDTLAPPPLVWRDTCPNFLVKKHLSTACGAGAGRVELEISGGSPGLPFTVEWAHGATGTSLAGLSEGTFKFEIVQGGCHQTDSIQLIFKHLLQHDKPLVFRGSDYDYWTKIIEAPNGDLLMGGTTTSPEHLAAVPTTNSSVVLRRTAVPGKTVWTKVIGGSRSSYLQGLLTLPQGGFLAAVSTFSDDGDFQNLQPSGSKLVLFWLDVAGNVLFRKSYSFGSEYGLDGFTRLSDNSIMLSFSKGSDETVSRDLLKIDGLGNILWQQNEIQDGLMLNDFWLAPGGKIWASGSKAASGWLNFKAWLGVLDSEGNPTEKFVFGKGSSVEYFEKIVPRPDGKLLALGMVGTYNLPQIQNFQARNPVGVLFDPASAQPTQFFNFGDATDEQYPNFQLTADGGFWIFYDYQSGSSLDRLTRVEADLTRSARLLPPPIFEKFYARDFVARASGGLAFAGDVDDPTGDPDAALLLSDGVFQEEKIFPADKNLCFADSVAFDFQPINPLFSKVTWPDGSPVEPFQFLPRADTALVVLVETTDGCRAADQWNLKKLPRSTIYPTVQDAFCGLENGEVVFQNSEYVNSTSTSVVWQAGEQPFSSLKNLAPGQFTVFAAKDTCQNLINFEVKNSSLPMLSRSVPQPTGQTGKSLGDVKKLIRTTDSGFAACQNYNWNSSIYKTDSLGKQPILVETSYVEQIAALPAGRIAATNGSIFFWFDEKLVLEKEYKLDSVSTKNGRVAAAPDGKTYFLFDSDTKTGSVWAANRGASDLWLHCFSENKTLLWRRNLGGSGVERAVDLRFSSDGFLWVGAVSNSQDFDLAGKNRGSDDVWILKIDPADGSILENFTFGGSEKEELIALAVGETGLAILANSWSSDGTFAPADNADGKKSFIFNFSKNGQTRWLRRTVGLAATFGYNDDLQFFENDDLLANVAGQLLRLDAAGEVRWQRLGLGGEFVPTADGLAMADMYVAWSTPGTHGCCYGMASELYFFKNSTLPPDFQALSDTSLCSAGDTLLLELETSAAQILWSNGQNQATASITQPGIFSVKAWDVAGCEVFDTLRVEFCNLDFFASDSLFACEKLVLASGVPPVFQQRWSDGWTLPEKTVVASGWQRLTVTNFAGEQFTDSVFVKIFENKIEVSAAVTQPFCNGDANGAIDLTATSPAAGPLQFVWQDGSTEEDRAGIEAGPWQVTVTDGWGCSLTQNIMVGQPNAMYFNLWTKRPTCFGYSDGSVWISNDQIHNGLAPFTYLWNTGDTTSKAENLPVGNYGLTVTDARGCTAKRTIDLFGYDSLEVVEIVVQPTDSAANGSIKLYVSGGNYPHKVVWDAPGLAGQTLTNLPPGVYNYVVTDANGCQSSGQIVLNAIVSTGEAASEHRLSAKIYPNPSLGEAWLEVNLPEACDLEIAVFDAAGRAVGRPVFFKNLPVGRQRFSLFENGFSTSAGCFRVFLKTEKVAVWLGWVVFN